jgi:hypothetical protein
MALSGQSAEAACPLLGVKQPLTLLMMSAFDPKRTSRARSKQNSSREAPWKG